MAVATNKTDIKELTRDALVSWLADRNIRAFRAGQILRWVYQRQVDRFADMSDLGKALRADLAAHFTVGRLAVARVETSSEGAHSVSSSPALLAELSSARPTAARMIAGAMGTLVSPTMKTMLLCGDVKASTASNTATARHTIPPIIRPVFTIASFSQSALPSLALGATVSWAAP